MFHSEHRNVDSTRKRHPHPLLQINPQKAAELGIEDGAWVWVETRRDSRIKRRKNLRKLYVLRRDKYGYDAGNMIGGIIGILVVVVVGLALLAPIQTSVDETVDNTSISPAAGTLVDLIPLLVVVGLLLSIVFWAIATGKFHSGV